MLACEGVITVHDNVVCTLVQEFTNREMNSSDIVVLITTTVEPPNKGHIGTRFVCPLLEVTNVL